MKLTIEEKVNIYFSRYKTGSSFTVKEYLEVIGESKETGFLMAKIEEIKKIYSR